MTAGDTPPDKSFFGDGMVDAADVQGIVTVLVGGGTFLGGVVLCGNSLGVVSRPRIGMDTGCNSSSDGSIRGIPPLGAFAGNCSCGYFAHNYGCVRFKMAKSFGLNIGSAYPHIPNPTSPTPAQSSHKSRDPHPSLPAPSHAGKGEPPPPAPWPAPSALSRRFP